MKTLTPILIAFFLTLFLSSNAFAQPTTLDFYDDGKKFQVQDDHSKRVSNVEIKKGGVSSVVKTYGTMYVSFLASMIATEIWYCNKSNFKDIATLDFSNTTDFEEVPTCRKDLFQMMKDPSMHAGIFAMTYTSLKFTKFADRKTEKIMKKLFKAKAEKPIALLQSFWQSVGMGLGISVQTIINSTYNSPSLPQCMTEMKDAVLKKGLTVEDAMKGQICQDAYQAFVSFENGTMSEITIAMYSLAFSTAATIGTIQGIQIIGLYFLGASPQGLLFKGGLYAANLSIEFFDRWMETTIRKYYHINRSERLLEKNVERLIESLEGYEKSGSFFNTKTVVDPKQHPRKKSRSPRKIKVKNFGLLDEIQEYQKNIDYRRRSKLNTFIDSHAMWQQKLAGINEIYTIYKDFLKSVITIRSERLIQTEMMNGDPQSYNPMGTIGLSRYEIQNYDMKSKLIGSTSSFFLNSSQRESLKQAVSSMIDFVQPKYANQDQVVFNSGARGLPALKTALKSLNEDDDRRLRIDLWRLKGIMSRYYRLDGINTVYDDSTPPLRLLAVLEGVSSFTPITARGLMLFESNGIVGATPVETLEKKEGDATHTTKRTRKGVISTEKVDILQVHPDTRMQHSIHKLANLLIHSVCNSNQEVMYDYGAGTVAKVTFPSMLKLQKDEVFDCAPIQTHPSDRVLEGEFEDHYYNKGNGKLVSIKTTPALHSVFVKDGKEYLGLIDLLTDPEVEIRWNSMDELNTYWEEDVVPGYLNLLGRGKKNYQNFLKEHYRLFDGDKGFIAYFLESEKAATRPETLDPFSNKSFRERDLEVYYESIKSGQAFLDHVRTVQHVLKTIGVENERTEFLKQYFLDLQSLLKMLDVTAYIDIVPSEDYQAEDMAINPILKLLGPEKYVELVKLNNKISKGFADHAKTLKEVPDYNAKYLPTMSNERAKAVLEKVAFEGLHKLYKDAVHGEIFTDYLTGDGFIYSEELDNGIRTGTYVE